MGLLAVTGATCTCPFGTAPSNLVVTSQAVCLVEGKPAATIQDMQPNVNLAPFGMCMSLANPAVASATAAAFGVLTPQPGTMMPAGCWTPSAPMVMVGGKPCLSSDSILTCAMGAGMIKIVTPGQFKVTV